MNAASPRMAATWARLQAQGRKALIPFITAGDPAADTTPALMQALAEGGADIIELGVPFSDPSADGPVIQRATERALARGIGMAQVLAMVRQFRQHDDTTPVVLMGYANPIERYEQRHGAGAFARDAQAAGVDGVLVVDVPPEECEALAGAMRAARIDLIFLLAPTSTEARMAQIGAFATGYVYYVSLKGVTGAGHLDVAAVADALPRIKRHVAVPVGVGFGIRDAATARAIGAVADGVIIGSRLIELLQNETGDNAPLAARAFMRDMRQALDAVET
ncbi:MAG: tryptophan synthase subunit alpha [Proteobacteria bacterium]|nr:tryptophan synthase subunit alpha [Pseudomonadota bacterium]